MKDVYIDSAVTQILESRGELLDCFANLERNARDFLTRAFGARKRTLSFADEGCTKKSSHPREPALSIFLESDVIRAKTAISHDI